MSGCAEWCGESRSLPSLRDAVHFVMGGLAPRDRAIASITTDQGLFTIDEGGAVRLAHSRVGFSMPMSCERGKRK